MPKDHKYPLERLEPALLAAAITPGLRSILLFDASRRVLDAVAAVLEQMLGLVTGRVVIRRYLGAGQHQDDLWVRPNLLSEEGRLAVTLDSGALMGDMGGGKFSVVIVPDLTELSLAAARGCVALMGSDVAHLERHGASLQWLPEACWLAACDRSAIGKVSPHLLDRFALRLDAAWEMSVNERVKDIRRWILDESVFKARLAKRVTGRLRAAAAVKPEVLPETFDRILELLPSRDGAGSRREIALARLAMACARLADPGTPVGREQVDQAAMLLDLPLAVVAGEPTGPLTGTEDTPSTEAEVPLDPALGQAAIPGDGSAASASVEQPVLAADPPEAVGQAQLPDDQPGPYPEDQAVRERDITSLREGPTRSQSTTVPRGSIIGVQQAHSGQDLALLQTVLSAAIWQPYRRMHTVGEPDGHGLRFLPSDLRSYRRAPAPEQLLALVIDYTCLEGWDWTAPLLPFLRWAYVERAGIVLVRVGAEDNPAETRADRLATRSLLDPRLDLALAARPGHATPLAHGLFLALQALQHGLQHGEGTVRRARLVVVTDGRGNVPLDVDADLKVTSAVRRGGVEDAQEVAAGIRALAAVETFLIDPEPDLYPELVSQLAQALGAELVRGRPAEAAEEAKAT
jgi:magnesium chelatase subunit D